MTTSEIIGLALKILALLLGYLFERNVEKKAQKAELIKKLAANLKQLQEAVDAGDISDFNRHAGGVGSGM